MNEARPAPTARPTVASEPPAGPRVGFLAGEWGLMTLALVLAVLLWLAVRDTVVIPLEIPGVKVRPIVSPGFSAHVEGTVTLKLRGPTGEVEAAQGSLGDRGNEIKIVVANLDEDERKFEAADRYSFEAFPEHLVESLPPPAGHVFRLVEQQVDVLDPEVTGTTAGVVHRIDSLEPRRFTVLAPKGAIDGPIAPDPIDAAAFLARGPALTLPQSYALTFDRWRGGARPGGEGQDAEKAIRRAGVQLRPVQATVTFQATASRKIENRLVKDVPAGHDYTLRSAVDGLGDAWYRGEIWATESTLNKLEASKDKWYYAIHVFPPDPPLKRGEKGDGQATIEWVALSDEFRSLFDRKLIRFERQPLRVDLTAR